MQPSTQTLADRVDSFPDPWLHEPGDKLVGEVIELTKVDKSFGPYSLITVLVTEPGSTEQGGTAIPAGTERVWHPFRTVPENELKKLAARIGDLIAAKYFGVRDGTDYKPYRIVLDPKPAARTGEIVDGAAGDAGHVDAGEGDAGEHAVEGR
jgi:hypothetical protein